MTDEYDPFDSSEGAASSDEMQCVELEFPTLRRFREEMAPYLNYEGFFARTERPLARDTLVEFKFLMPEEFVLAQGTAVVAWVINAEENPDLVPGMALRFNEVEKQSRAVIDELVDFHIATGGDPFNMGPGSSDAGEIPTDALVGSDVDTPTLFEDQPPILHHPGSGLESGPPTPTTDDGVLPDWLSKRSEKDEFGLGKPADEAVSSPAPSKSLDLLADSSADGYEVEMIFDDSAEDSTPVRPEEEPSRQMEMAPEADGKPPRDLRLGLVVMAAMVLVALVVLVWSFWLRKSEVKVADVQTVVEQENAAGVALIDDDVDAELREPSADVEEESPEEAAMRLAAEMAQEIADRLEDVSPTDFEDGVSAPDEESVGERVREAVPTKDFVRESPPDTPLPTVAAGPASRVVDVVAAARNSMTTVVIRGNGIFTDSALRVSRMKDPLRLWVRVRNIETFYRPNEIKVDSADVHRVRIGYHPEETPAALYVVLDLVDDDVVLLEKRVQGDAIHISVGRR